MKLQYSSEQLSKISASALLELIGMDNTHPVDPYDVAMHLGVEVDSSFDIEKVGKSGSITKIAADEYRIWLNPVDSENRRKFTLAHELGHLVNDLVGNGDISFEDDASTLYRSLKNQCPKEYRANNFAGQLLMPLMEIKKDLSALVEEKNQWNMSELVDAMAQEFNVSRDAMTVRLRILKFI